MTTGSWDQQPADADRLPLARLRPAIRKDFAPPEVVSGGVAMLASNDGPYITGTEVRIDGGACACSGGMTRFASGSVLGRLRPRFAGARSRAASKNQRVMPAVTASLWTGSMEPAIPASSCTVERHEPQQPPQATGACEPFVSPSRRTDRPRHGVALSTGAANATASGSCG